MLQTHQSGGTHLSYNTLLYFLLCTELSSLFGAFSDHFQDQWYPNPALLKSSELKEESRWGSIWQGEISPDFQWPWCLQSSLRRYFIALLTPKLSMPVSYTFQGTTGGSAVKLIPKRLWRDHIDSFYCGEGQGLLQKIADLNRAQGVSW